MTKNEKRAAAIARNLNVSPIANVSPSYQTATPSHYSSEVEYITVTLDKLRPYEHNPRKTRNPNFEMIKESIRRRGLDHKPNVTRRPGEDFYIIADGGNTRIQALKELFTETQDPRFWSISCEYKPWQGDSADSVEAELNILIGHLIENDTRADLSFIEKALGILQAKEYYEKKLEKSLSARELSTELEKDGYIIHQTLISKMERCVAYLYPHIPDVLFRGLGHTQIDKLLAIRNNADEVWHHYHLEVDTPFEDIWASSLASCNDDVPFQARDFQDKLIIQMADLLEGKTTYESLYLEIDLDERKFKKIAAKQHEIENHVEHSLEQIIQHQEEVKLKPIAYAIWGCKWNVCEDSCYPCFNSDGSIDCFFDTAWNPPEAWFATLCETFPDIEFTLSFYEPGMWFAGEYVANLDGTYHEIIIDDCEIQSFAEDVFDASFEDDIPAIKL